MSDLIEYYERLIEVFKADVENMLNGEDVKLRAPKVVMGYLEAIEQCQHKVTALNDAASIQTEWDQLSAKAKGQILRIIEDDMQ